MLYFFLLICLSHIRGYPVKYTVYVCMRFITMYKVLKSLVNNVIKQFTSLSIFYMAQSANTEP